MSKYKVVVVIDKSFVSRLVETLMGSDLPVTFSSYPARDEEAVPVPVTKEPHKRSFRGRGSYGVTTKDAVVLLIKERGQALSAAELSVGFERRGYKPTSSSPATSTAQREGLVHYNDRGKWELTTKGQAYTVAWSPTT